IARGVQRLVVPGCIVIVLHVPATAVFQPFVWRAFWLPRGGREHEPVPVWVDETACAVRRPVRVQRALGLEAPRLEAAGDGRDIRLGPEVENELIFGRRRRLRVVVGDELELT